MLEQELGLFWTQIGRSDFCIKILRHRETSEKWWYGNGRSNTPIQPLLGDFSSVFSCRFVFLFVLCGISSCLSAVSWQGVWALVGLVTAAPWAQQPQLHMGEQQHILSWLGTSCSSPAVGRMWGGWGCSGLWQWTPSYVLLVFLRAFISPYAQLIEG